MKQPAAILVLQYWYTILVIPVFYQYLPVSAILVQILVNTSIPVSSRIFCNTRRYWSLPKYEYCRYRKILGNTGNTNIADTGNTGYTSIADIGRLGRIPVNPSVYVYIILKELNTIHTHTSFLLYIT